MPSYRQIRDAVNRIGRNTTELCNLVQLFDVDCCNCDSCHELILMENEGYWLVDGDTICDSCYQGAETWIDNNGECHYGSAPEDEDEDEDEENGEIPRYHAVTLPYQWVEDGDVRFGIELEVYCPNRAGFAAALSQIPGYTDVWKYERDGSLDDDHGLEIVAVPITLASIQSDDGFWRKVFDLLAQHECMAHDAGTTYGMHVNIDDRTFSDDRQRSQFVELMRASGTYSSWQGIHEKVAQRKGNDYCRYGKKDNDHYAACAVDCHRLECRHFRSSTRWERFIKNIEYVAAIVDGIRQEGTPVNRLKYPTLIAFLEEKGITIPAIPAIPELPVLAEINQ